MAPILRVLSRSSGGQRKVSRTTPGVSIDMHLGVGVGVEIQPFASTEVGITSFLGE